MTPGPSSVLVVVRADPRKTHRAVEALRIALGLSTGPNPVSVALLEDAPLLLTEDADLQEEIVDGEILQRHLPALKDLEIPLLVPFGAAARYHVDPEYRVREETPERIARLAAEADRVLVF